MFSSGYDIGDIPRGRLRRRGGEARRPPVHDAIDALDAYRPPDGRRAARATRSAAASSSRWPATCASPPTASSSACRRPSSASSTRTPACAASSTRSAPRARASCSCSAATSTRARALRWGLVNESSIGGRPRGDGARAGRASSPPTRRCRVQGNKRVIARAAARRGRARPGGRARADRAARGLLRLGGHEGGRPRLRREAPGALARPLEALIQVRGRSSSRSSSTTARSATRSCRRWTRRGVRGLQSSPIAAGHRAQARAAGAERGPGARPRTSSCRARSIPTRSRRVVLLDGGDERGRVEGLAPRPARDARRAGRRRARPRRPARRCARAARSLTRDPERRRAARGAPGPRRRAGSARASCASASSRTRSRRCTSAA